MVPRTAFADGRHRPLDQFAPRNFWQVAKRPALRHSIEAGSAGEAAPLGRLCQLTRVGICASRLEHGFDDNVYDLNVILHPGAVFNHPREVLADRRLAEVEMDGSNFPISLR
jgi:hypothetical protein